MSKVTPELKLELSRWLRPVSSMTAFAKSLKNEGPSDNQGSPQSQQQPQIDDPYKDIDLDELPDNVRAAVEKSRGLLQSSKSEIDKAQEKLQKTENFARTVQSQRDKLDATLKRHNLSPDAPSNQPSVSEQEAMEQQFLKDGLKPEAAKVYAKMFYENNKRVEQSILGKVMPLAESVGNLQADTVLSRHVSANPRIFAIPEVAKIVHENVKILADSGQVVSDAVVQNLTEMAFGKIAMTNPDALKGNQQQSQQVPNFNGTTMQSGVLANQQQQQQKQGPSTTQPETASIIANIATHLRQGLPTKK